MFESSGFPVSIARSVTSLINLFRVAPDRLDLPAVPKVAPQVTPVRCLFGCVAGWLPESSLRISRLSDLVFVSYPLGLLARTASARCPAPSLLCAFQSVPGPYTPTAGSMMTPRTDSNFASASAGVDESSSQPGVAHSCLALRMPWPLFNLGLPLLGLPRLASGQHSIWFVHRTSKLGNCVPNSLTGSSTEKESRPIRSVDTSAKLRKSCGYHQRWCISTVFLRAV